MTAKATYDVFISHASEDKAEVARPLAVLLVKAGLRVWLDEAELVLGDSLRRKIDSGLASSRFGVVVLSKQFFSKEWPQKELDGLAAKETNGSRVILPVWHNITAEEIASHSPILADRLSIRTDAGLSSVAAAVLRATTRTSNVDSVDSPIAANSGESTGDPRVEELLEIDMPKSIDQLLVELVDSVTDAAEQQVEVTGLRTGFYDIDRFVGGLHPGDVHVVAARPAMGRTTFVLNIAEHVSIAEGLPVLFFAPMDRSAELTNRLLASVSRIDRRRLSTGQLSEDEWKRFAEAVPRVREAPLYFHDSPALTLDAVVDRTMRLRAKIGALGLLVIDSGWELVAMAAESGSEMRRLRQLARDANCAVLFVVQVMRSVETRIDKRPTMQDLPMADQLVENSGAVFFLYRDDHYNRDSVQPGVMEVLIAKSRGSPRGVVRLAFMGPISRIDNLAEWSQS